LDKRIVSSYFIMLLSVATVSRSEKGGSKSRDLFLLLYRGITQRQRKGGRSKCTPNIWLYHRALSLST